MGYAKQQLENEYENSSAMAAVLKPHGYLSKCDMHDVYIDEMQGSDVDGILQDLKDNDEDLGQFGTDEDAKRAIKSALDNAGDHCPQCDKNMSD